MDQLTRYRHGIIDTIHMTVLLWCGRSIQVHQVNRQPSRKRNLLLHIIIIRATLLASHLRNPTSAVRNPAILLSVPFVLFPSFSASPLNPLLALPPHSSIYSLALLFLSLSSAPTNSLPFLPPFYSVPCSGCPSGIWAISSRLLVASTQARLS